MKGIKRLKEINYSIKTMKNITSCEKAITEAFNIYNSLDMSQQRNQQVINSMLNICLDTNHLEKISELHPYIINIKQQDISLKLLLKCCTKLSKINRNYTIILLQHIVNSLKDNDIHIKTSIINIYSECNNMNNA
eukprot:552512_1